MGYLADLYVVCVLGLRVVYSSRTYSDYHVCFGSLPNGIASLPHHMG
jgi:hypothetical protein